MILWWNPVLIWYTPPWWELLCMRRDFLSVCLSLLLSPRVFLKLMPQCHLMTRLPSWSSLQSMNEPSVWVAVCSWWCWQELGTPGQTRIPYGTMAFHRACGWKGGHRFMVKVGVAFSHSWPQLALRNNPSSAYYISPSTYVHRCLGCGCRISHVLFMSRLDLQWSHYILQLSVQ